uniref:DNA ligase 4 n=1 Tax=Cuerna arida TaxID=1464854 RepID=A0A1B6FIK3_9HEMI
MASTSRKNKELMFSEFCALCDKISSARRDKKADILQRFILDYHANNETSFYRVLRLLLPKLDRERAAYGIKEYVLANIYVRILCLHPESADALKLKNFRAPKNAGNHAGDFGEVAYWVLKSRCAEGGELTVDDVQRHLDAVALRHAERQPREKDKELEVMLRCMSAQEQKWLIRILLKDMRLGLGHTRILSVYHPDANDLWVLNNSLQQVCEKLRDPTRRLHEIEITLFNPFCPMLAERCNVQDIDKHLQRRPGPRYIETKLDGERSQFHYNNGEFRFFSRNAFDFTDSFGSSSTSGSLTPYLAKQLKPSVKNFILDGEMMPWNTKFKCFGTKGMNLDVKSLRVGNVHQPCFCAFDILYYNDSVLTNKPLSERLEILQKIFTPQEGIIMHVPRQTVNSSEEVLAALNTAIDNFDEGIIVKEPNSIYKPKSRKEDWIKIKPEYTPGAMVELDLLIIGGYYGEGRRRGLISHFLLALAQPAPDGEEPVVFESVTRVGSGCTMEELAALSRQLEPHWKRCQPNKPPTGLLWTREKPELWIEPQNSVILQVKASEVVRSDFYQTGYTLRFPRIEKVRYDKPWKDCLTTDEFTKLRLAASGSLVGSYITAQSPRAKKRRAAQPQPSVSAQFRATHLDHVKAHSQLFTGKEICVLTGLLEISKQDLERQVVENGGTVVLNPGKATYCVIVGTENIRVTNVCKAGTYNVVRAQWLLHSLDAGQLLEWTPADVVSGTPETMDQLVQQYDQYGDSFTQPATLHSLQHVLQQVGKKEMSVKQMKKLDQLLFYGCSPFSVFRGCFAYFDCYEKVGEHSTLVDTPLSSLVFDFKFQSGQVCPTVNDQTTHIVIHSSDLDRLEELISRAEQQSNQVHIIQHYWLLDCIEAKAQLSEEKYLLHQWE